MNTRTRTPAAPAAPSIHVKNGPTAHVATEDIDVGIHDRSIDLSSTISIEDLRDQLNAGAGNADSPMFLNFAETLAYMEERVLVRVQTSSEPHAEKIIEVWNDGIPQRFIRGEWVVAKRKFVEVLARATPFSVSTPEGLDGRGDKTRRLETHNGQRYPFEFNDPNNQAKGMAWLNGIYAEAQ